MPSTAQLPQLINVFGMQGRLGEVPETDHLRDEQGVPRICFGLTDVEAADGVGLHRVDDLNTEALLLKSGKKSEPVVSGGLHCKGNLVKRQLGLGEHGQQPIVPGAVVGEGKRLDDDGALAVNHRCLVLPLGDVDPNDVHSAGSSHVQITDIPRAAEGHNLLRDQKKAIHRPDIRLISDIPQGRGSSLCAVDLATKIEAGNSLSA